MHVFWLWAVRSAVPVSIMWKPKLWTLEFLHSTSSQTLSLATFLKMNWLKCQYITAFRALDKMLSPPIGSFRVDFTSGYFRFTSGRTLLKWWSSIYRIVSTSGLLPVYFRYPHKIAKTLLRVHLFPARTYNLSQNENRISWARTSTKVS